MMVKWCHSRLRSKNWLVHRVTSGRIYRKPPLQNIKAKRRPWGIRKDAMMGEGIQHDVPKLWWVFPKQPLDFVEDGMSTGFWCTKVSLAGFGRSTRCLQKTALRGVVLQPCLDCFDCTWKGREKTRILSELDHQNFTAIWNVARKTLRAGVQELLVT